MTKEQLDRANTIVTLQRCIMALGKAYDPTASDSMLGNSLGLLYRDDKIFHEEFSKSLNDAYKRLDDELKNM